MCAAVGVLGTVVVSSSLGSENSRDGGWCPVQKGRSILKIVCAACDEVINSWSERLFNAKKGTPCTYDQIIKFLLLVPVYIFGSSNFPFGVLSRGYN
jgi:hypothetical protein